MLKLKLIAWSDPNKILADINTAFRKRLGSFHDIHLERRNEMKKNMGTVDRGIRLSLAIIVAILYFTGRISGITALVIGIFAIAFFITSLVGHCPAYTPLGIKTLKENK